jgi:hypothetical protein
MNLEIEDNFVTFVTFLVPLVKIDCELLRINIYDNNLIINVKSFRKFGIY